MPESILRTHSWENVCPWKLWKYLVYGWGQVVASPQLLNQVFGVNAHSNLSIRFLYNYKTWNPWGGISDFLYDEKALKIIQFFLQFTLECYRNSPGWINHLCTTLFGFKLILTLQLSSILNELWSSEASLAGVDWHHIGLRHSNQVHPLHVRVSQDRYGPITVDNYKLHTVRLGVFPV